MFARYNSCTLLAISVAVNSLPTGLIVEGSTVSDSSTFTWQQQPFGNMTISNLASIIYPDTSRGYDHSLSFLWHDPSDPAGIVENICTSTWTANAFPSSPVSCGVPRPAPQYDNMMFYMPAYDGPGNFSLKLAHGHQFSNNSNFKVPWSTASWWGPDDFRVYLECHKPVNTIGCYLPAISASVGKSTPVSTIQVPIVSSTN